MSTNFFQRACVSMCVLAQIAVPTYVGAEVQTGAEAGRAGSESAGVASVRAGLRAAGSQSTLANFCRGDGVVVCIQGLVGSVVRVVLSLTGLVLLGYLIYAGFLWMTSGGETEKAKEAMTMIRNAIVGMVILASVFAIASFVLSSLTQISTGAAPRAAPVAPAPAPGPAAR